MSNKKQSSILLLILTAETTFTASPAMGNKWAEMPEEVKDAYAKAFGFEGKPTQNNLTDMAFAIEVEQLAGSQGVKVGAKTGEEWKQEIIALLQTSEEVTEEAAAPEVAPEVSVANTISPEAVTKVQTSALQMAEKYLQHNQKLNKLLIGLAEANEELGAALIGHIRTARELGIVSEVPALEEQVPALEAETEVEA